MKFQARDVTNVDNASADSVVLTLKNARGELLHLNIQLEMLLEAASAAQKSQTRQHNIAAVGPEEVRGQWKNGAVIDAKRWAVGTTPVLERTAIIVGFDGGGKWELNYRLSPEDAAQVGQALIDEAKKLASSFAPSKH